MGAFKEKFNKSLSNIDELAEKRQRQIEEKRQPQQQILLPKKPKLEVYNEQDFNYSLIETKGDIKELCGILKGTKMFGFDFETTTENPLEDLQITEKNKIVGISFAWNPGDACYIPIAHEGYENNFDLKVMQKFKTFFEDRKKIKVAHNVKFEAHWLKKVLIDLKTPIFDPLLGANLLKLIYQNIGLKDIIEQVFGYQMITYDEITGFVDELSEEVYKSGKNKGKQKVITRQRKFNEVPVDEDCLIYTCGDSDWALRLAPIVIEQLKEAGLYELCTELDIPLSLALVNMERNGWHTDPSYVKYLASVAETKLIEGELKIKKEIAKQLRINENELNNMLIPVGKNHKPLNLNSGQHLGWILFDQLKMPILKRTDKGKPSTDAEVLGKLQSRFKNIPLFDYILEYKKYETLQNTFINGYGGCIRENNRIHSTIDQVFVRTGRFSSGNPNLQNIPARQDPLGVKNMFVAPDGRLFLFIDYSQIELRIFAWYCGDENMKDAFRKGQDIHSRTAWEMFELFKPYEFEGVMYEPITLEEVPKKASMHRYFAKSINFGIIYGKQARSLANDLWKKDDDESIRKAQGFLNRYLTQYPKLVEYQKEQIGLARQNGYVTTMFNRMRLIPDIESHHFSKRGYSERTAYNTPIQGSASEIIKMAMVKINQQLPVDMIMQIHDELVIEIPVEEFVKRTKQIKKIMEMEIDGFDVPLVADCKIAQRAGEKKALILDGNGAVELNEKELASESYQIFAKKLEQGGIKIVA